jgi:hypothetical protein
MRTCPIVYAQYSGYCAPQHPCNKHCNMIPSPTPIRLMLPLLLANGGLVFASAMFSFAHWLLPSDPISPVLGVLVVPVIGVLVWRLRRVAWLIAARACGIRIVTPSASLRTCQ